MGHPLSIDTSTLPPPLPKLTLKNLNKIPDGPSMMANAMQEQSHEKVALGIPTVPKEQNKTGYSVEAERFS
ncbi:hypothetical protein FSST1_009703 [Fusarium sambucinum]